MLVPPLLVPSLGSTFCLDAHIYVYVSIMLDGMSIPFVSPDDSLTML